MATTKAAPSPVEEEEFQGTVVDTWEDLEEEEFVPSEFPVLERGIYGWALAGVEVRPGNKGEYLNVKFLHRQEEEDEDGAVATRKYYMWHSLFLTPKTIGQTKRVLRILGMSFEGIPYTPGECPMELLERIEDMVDPETEIIDIDVRKTRYKSKKDDEFHWKNEAVRFLDAALAGGSD